MRWVKHGLSGMESRSLQRKTRSLRRSETLGRKRQETGELDRSAASVEKRWNVES